MLTAETITDEQIRELRASNIAILREPIGVDLATRIRLSTENAWAETVLVNADIPDEMRREGRERCAEILNKRNESRTGVCWKCGDQIARDGTCAHVRKLLDAARISEGES